MIINQGPRKLEFNQTERITARLRDLVRNYPKGLGLVKEFLQNSDDAGATRLVMIYDRRHHNGSFSDYPEIKVALGPSLLFVNDQIFSEEDFKRIQQIGEGGKVREAARTGRFGQGFNTCYSVSDHPSLLTGEAVAWFDPHHRVFGDVANASAWPLVEVEKYWPDWIKTFEIAGWSKSLNSFSGTAFRLPLRSVEDAEQSEILKEPFSYDDFLKILDELHQIGAALLIFLRSVSMLEIREIDIEGNDHLRFKISTNNFSEVDEHRNSLRAIVDGNPKYLIENWIETRKELPLVNYDHSFSIHDIDGSRRDELWSVVTGLFRGPDDILLQNALEVLKHDEKAIPWAGAAICRNSLEQNLKYGGLSCFLPIPEQTKWPVWLHGWFDLSSNRRGITRDADVGETTKSRHLWNKSLMEHAVGKAWALLIHAIKGKPDENVKPYHYWLRPTDKPDEVDLALIKGFYQSISELSVIRCRNSAAIDWYVLDNKISDLHADRSERLSDPLLAEGWILTYPSLPEFVRQGFRWVKKSLTIITPKFIRDELLNIESDIDISCSLENYSRPMLSKREWIYDLTEFCAEKNFSNLNKLPLALLSDGLLHTFTVCGKLFLSTNDEKNLLYSLPERFLDKDFQEVIGLNSPVVEIKLLSFNLPILLEFVPDILLKITPEDIWLIKFFDYITSCDENVVTSQKDILNNLKLIPDQNGSLCKMGLVETPLIPGKVSKELLNSLKEIGIPILTCNKKLLEAISRFSTKHIGFVWELTPDDIAYNLKDHAEKTCLNEAALDNRTILDPILDFLSSTSWLNEVDERLALLRKICLFPTISGQRVAAEDDSVYIPGGFTPPLGVGGQYRLLDLGKDKSWINLYKAFGVPTLDGSTFVVKVLLPAFSSATLEQCRTYLIWIRDEFRIVERDLTEDQRKQLNQRIQRTPILPIEGGGMDAPRFVYRPNATEPVDLLGEFAQIPDKKFFSTSMDLWRAFFDDLDLPRRPLARDIYGKIKALSDESSLSGTALVRVKIRNLLEYLRDNWSSISFHKVDGSVTLADALAKIAWLPASTEGGNYAASSVWEDKLWRPNELVPGRHANLVASKYPVLEGYEPPKEMSEALGLLLNITLADVLEHFSKVRVVIFDDVKSIDAVLKAAEGFYRYIGQFDPSKADLLNTSLNNVKNTPCIFISGKWWFPSQCFFEPLPFATDFAISLSKSDLNISDSSVYKGLSLLGIRQHPDKDVWIEMLSDFADEFDGIPLPQEKLKQVRYAIRLLRSETTEWLQSEDIFVPLINGHLINACNSLVPDDPRIKNFTSSNPLPLIEDNEDAIDVGRRAGANSLHRSLIERLKIKPSPTKNPYFLNITNNIETNLRSKQFYQCLQRIAYEEAIKSRDMDIDPIEAASTDKLRLPKKMHVIICPSISIETVVEIDDEEIVVSDLDSVHFLEHELPRLWLKEGKLRRIKDEIVRAICKLCNLSDQLRLSRVLDVVPERMSSVLDEEEVATLPEGQIILLESNQDDVVAESILTPIISDHCEKSDVIEVENEDTEEEIENFSTLEMKEESNLAPPEYGASFPGSEIFKISKGQNPLSSLVEMQVSGTNAPTIINEIDRGTVDQITIKQESRTQQTHPGAEYPSSPRSGESPPNHHQPLGTIATKTSHPSGPPTKPGEGSSKPWDSSIKNEPDKTKQVRLRTYVHEKIHDDYDNGTSDSHSKALGDAGEAIVMEFEAKQKRIALLMPVNHEGYDIESNDSDGLRYIEVKSIDGPWGDRGVGVTRAQYEAAMRLGNKWWLYVVEHVTDSANAIVHPILNPFHLATEYRFDSGWKKVEVSALASLSVSTKPSIGASYERDSGDVVKIEGLTQHGQFWRVRFLNSDGSKQSAIWNASWRLI